jgi:hypothetical protein
MTSKDTELEIYETLNEENRQLKKRETRSKRIIFFLSILITITSSVLITIFILNADEIFHSCENGNELISQSVEEMRELHEQTQKMNRELMDFLFSHEINQGIRNQQILDEGNGFLWTHFWK